MRPKNLGTMLIAALIALAGGTRIGFAGGVAAAGLYALGVIVTPRLPTRDVLTLATAALLNSLEDGPHVATPGMVPTYFVARGSTGPAPK